MSAAGHLKIIAVNVVGRGTLLGTIDVEVWIFRFRNCAVIRTDNGVFVGLPRSARIGRDGYQQRDTISGKPQFDALVEWIDKDWAGRFQTAILALIRRDHPALLGNDSPPPPALPLPAPPRKRRPVARANSPELPDDRVDDLWRGK